MVLFQQMSNLFHNPCTVLTREPRNLTLASESHLCITIQYCIVLYCIVLVLYYTILIIKIKILKINYSDFTSAVIVYPWNSEQAGKHIQCRKMHLDKK